MIEASILITTTNRGGPILSAGGNGGLLFFKGLRGRGRGTKDAKHDLIPASLAFFLKKTYI